MMSPGKRRGRPLTRTTSRESVSTASSSVRDGLDQAIDNAQSDWLYIGLLTGIRELAQYGQGFTAETLVDLVGMPSEPCYVGAAFAAAQRMGVIEQCGARIGRSGPQRIWWGTDAGGDAA